MTMEADTIRNQRVYPPLRIFNEYLVLVDDPAPFPHPDSQLPSELGNIV